MYSTGMADGSLKIVDACEDPRLTSNTKQCRAALLSRDCMLVQYKILERIW